MTFRSNFAGFSLVFIVAALCAVPAAVRAQTTPDTPTQVPVTSPEPAAAGKPILQDADKEKDIRLLITLTGGDKMGDQMMDRMIPEMQKMLPQAPATFWQEFRKKMKMSDLVDRLMPIYDKYYSKEDVKGLIQFYQSPLGQKVTSVMPSVGRESYAVGAAWGQEKAQEVISELQAKEAAQPAKPVPAKAKPAKASAAKPRKAVSH